MGWQDKQFERTDEYIAYPFIQWVNAGGNLEPRAPTGGFAMPLDQAEMVDGRIPGEVRLLHHRNGEQTEVIFTTALEVAVLATRFTWIKDGVAVPEYEPGARGKLQALALVRDLDGKAIGPVLLTFRGVVGKQFSAALKEHRETVRKATKGQAPSYAFFGKFQAGEVEMVGSQQKSPITTLVYVADDFDPDAAYIGDEAVDQIPWPEIDAWKAAWENGNGNGNGHTDDEDDEVQAEAVAEAPAPTPKEDRPASRAQWALIRRLMEAIGIKGEEKQNRALCEKGFDPDNLTVEQASELIERLQKAKAQAGK